MPKPEGGPSAARVRTWVLPEAPAAAVKGSLGMKFCSAVSRLACTDENVRLRYHAALSHASAWELHEG